MTGRDDEMGADNGDVEQERRPTTGGPPVVPSPGDSDAPDQPDTETIYPDEPGVPGVPPPPEGSPPGRSSP